MRVELTMMMITNIMEEVMTMIMIMIMITTTTKKGTSMNTKKQHKAISMLTQHLSMLSEIAL
jgi:hypothetical protein